MTIKKVNYFTATNLFGLLIQILLFISCTENKNGKENETVQKYDGVTIEVDISNKNCLDILLAADGTINRKGSGIVDTLDKDFFMGLTKDKLFDSLMNGISNDLLTYCGKPTNCDTLKPTCKVTIAFGNNYTACEINYCINGTLNDLPESVKEFIQKAMMVTEPWYQDQKKILLTRKLS